MRHARTVLASICVLSSGCASWFMNGGRLVDGHYAPTVVGRYQAPTCTTTTGGVSIKGADVLYEVVRDGEGVALFERSRDGSGAVITNHWADDKADHFFGWVMSNGWEYVVSKDPAGPSSRIVYVGVQKTKEGDVTKPTSPSAAVCPLVAAR